MLLLYSRLTLTVIVPKFTAFASAAFFFFEFMPTLVFYRFWVSISSNLHFLGRKTSLYQMCCNTCRKDAPGSFFILVENVAGSLGFSVGEARTVTGLMLCGRCYRLVSRKDQGVRHGKQQEAVQVLLLHRSMESRKCLDRDTT